MARSGLVAAVLGAALAVSLVWPDQVQRLMGRTPSIEASFQTFVARQNELTVQRAGMVSILSKRDDGLIDALDTTTYAIVPGSVRYAVYPARIGRGDFRWDRANATLTVTLADPQPVDVNIDGARAQVLVDGIDLQGGDRRQQILQASLDAARADMARRARQPALLQAARDAAREALTANFAAPLLAAGLQPNIILVFRGESQPPAITKG
jgi:hypothetical protein